jgi:hypothetical protein
MNVVRMFHDVEEFEKYMGKQMKVIGDYLPAHAQGLKDVYIKERSKHAAAGIEPEKSLIVSYIHRESVLGCNVEVRCFVKEAEKPLLKNNLELMAFTVYEGQTMFSVAASPGR